MTNAVTMSRLDGKQMLTVAEKRRLANRVHSCLADRAEVRPFPAAVTQLATACHDPNATAATFEEIIKCDPALAVRILRMANSPLYGLSNEVRSIGHATVVLGIRKLRSLALSVAGAKMFSEGKTASRDRKALWNHSLGCATIARLLADSVSHVLPEDAFLAGIFHDVGKLLLYDVVPHEYACIASENKGARLIEEEEFVFGLNHQDIGLKSAHSWKLPEQIKAAIGHHHNPDSSPLHREFVIVIHAANSLARSWCIGSDSEEEYEMSQSATTLLALDDESLATFRLRSLRMFQEAVRSWAL
jgi:putative nucleotidyltransferase with HDIG domain